MPEWKTGWLLLEFTYFEREWKKMWKGSTELINTTIAFLCIFFALLTWYFFASASNTEESREGTGQAHTGSALENEQGSSTCTAGTPLQDSVTLKTWVRGV